MNNNQILLDIEPTAEFTRHSEGAFVTIKSGELLFIYSRFTKSDDHSPAQLVEMRSTDEGKTWSEAKTIVSNENGLNVMSVSLLRLQDGRIALFYLQKNGLRDCLPVVQFSNDEAQTWSAPQPTYTAPGYHVLNNDRVIQLTSGRLVLPVALHRSRHLDATKKSPTDWRGIVFWYLSDDGGATWREAQNWWTLPVHSQSGLQEPGVVELEDGTIFSWARTDQGRQYFFRSRDGGETWSAPQPSTLISPNSPTSIKRLPNSPDLLAIYNDHSGEFPLPPHRGRTPLVAAISSDGGANWHNHQLIEDDPNAWYCYTAMHFVGDGVLLAYIAGTKDNHLSRLRMRRIEL